MSHDDQLPPLQSFSTDLAALAELASFEGLSFELESRSFKSSLGFEGCGFDSLGFESLSFKNISFESLNVDNLMLREREHFSFDWLSLADWFNLALLSFGKLSSDLENLVLRQARHCVPVWERDLVPPAPNIPACSVRTRAMINEFVHYLNRLRAFDEKLAPIHGEDETRIAKLFDTKTGKCPSITARMFRSLIKRWLRACNNSMKNYEHAVTGKRIDGCPRLTRARRLVARSTPRARETAREQKRAWRQQPEVKKREARQKKHWRLQNIDKDKALRKADYERARDENYHRPFVAIDFEGMN